jgi:diguanylate cyclase (GGDEF)-like protein/PAS domain S-box-containing protein
VLHDALILAGISGGIIYCVMHLFARRQAARLADASAAEARFRSLTELSADWFWETDAEHRITWLSGGTPVATFFGHTPTYGKRFWELPRVEVEAGALAAHLERLDIQLPFFDLEIARSDERGARQIHIVSGKARLSAAGRFLGYRGVGRDVTEQRSAERRLGEAKQRLEIALEGARKALTVGEQRFRDLVEASGEFVWETDAQWRFTYLSERVEAVLGYPRTELLGKTPKDFMPLGEERLVEEWLAKNGGPGRPFRDMVHRSIHKSGAVVWQVVSGVPIFDGVRLAGYRGTAADLTARKQADARIEHLATRDALTGLPNRALLAERGGQAIVGAARSRARLALLCIDLDRFKLVNETLGHGAGDALLRAVAERLQSALRREDLLARVSGDDFALLWNDLKSNAEAEQLAQRVLAILARPFILEGRALNVGASIGIALYPGDGRDFGELLRNAEAAMYHAKDGGRGTWRFYKPELSARAAVRLQVENELRSALARSELVLHWQPVVRGRGDIVGAEALVRWQHPVRGLLLPAEFVPLAEECGLIRSVGEWTLERALSQVGAWQRSLPGTPWFAVNVSAPELAQGDAYVERIRNALKENGVDGHRIELEVTERALMPHLHENLETLRRIGELGVRLAIDDFGTGYSSLAYLRRLPIDKLKIDRLFMGSIDSNAADEAIVRTIASLAKTLGIAVAAEGIEGGAQLECLLALGCEQWQGHYFSESLDAAGFEKLVTAGRLRNLPAANQTP